MRFIGHSLPLWPTDALETRIQPITRLFVPPLLTRAELAFPAAAQDAGGGKLRVVILYCDDKSALSTDPDDVFVVAHLLGNDRYRRPKALRFSDDPANLA